MIPFHPCIPFANVSKNPNLIIVKPVRHVDMELFLAFSILA